MSEPLNPYSEQARGQQQIADEQVMLQESYAYGQQQEVSQAVLAQHQARITELLERQQYRRETGTSYLSPMRAKVERPAAVAPEPEPDAGLGPMRIVVHGELVDASGYQAPQETDGARQVRTEQEQEWAIYEQGSSHLVKNADGTYGLRSAAEQRRLQQAARDFTERRMYRQATGEDYIDPAEERPR